MKNRLFRVLKNSALFFVTPITIKQQQKWKVLAIYMVIAIPAILYTYNFIDRYDSLYNRNIHMNKSIIRVLEKKNIKLSNKKEHYRKFTEITKEDECLQYSSQKENRESYSKSSTNNKEWEQCVNKNSLSQRINNFISTKHSMLASFYSPNITFTKFSTTTRNIINSPVEYVTSPPVEHEFFTALPVKLMFKSTFEKTLDYMKKLNAQCSSCQISIDELSSIENNKLYNVVLMIIINLESLGIEMKNELSQQVSSGVYSGKNLANFVNSEPNHI